MNATDLTLIQRGSRRYVIERSYRYLPWHPASLFSHVMREAIFNFSNHPQVDSVASAAAEAFMSAALQPGLDLRNGANPYKLSQDFCATARTILEHISRGALPQLHRKPDTVINGTPWSFLSPVDEMGVFHRWVFVDSIDDDVLYHHARSWETFADQCVAPAMTALHIYAIGSTRDGRRISPWCRVYTSPAVANVYRFQKKSGEQLQGEWKPRWFADSTKTQASTWVTLMEQDNILPNLVKHVMLPEPSELHRAQFLGRDLPMLTNSIALALGTDPFALPMCRTSCDTPFPCPHEHACYSAVPSASVLEKSGLYVKLPARQAGITQSRS